MESGSGSSKKRTRDTCWRTIKMREMGERVIEAILSGNSLDDVPDFPVDLKADEYRHRFPKYKFAATEVMRKDNPVPRDVEATRKEFYSSYLKDQKKKALADQKKLPDLSQLNIDTTEEEEFDHKSDYEYPNIDDFMKLDEMERIKTKDFQRDMARYTRDEEKSDGFDAGFYPYRDAAGICGSGFIFRHYKPPHVNLPKAYLNTLVHLSQLAISVYNMHQLQPTHYDSVQVLKAMKFGPYATNFNITFQASFPIFPTTFQTRVYNRCYPAFTEYSEFEIVLVRKFKGGEDASDKNLSSQETDYVGVESLPGFPSSMQNLSDFNEEDPQSDTTLPIPSEYKLPLYLCQFALHQYNIALHQCDEDHDKDDELYDNVKVLSILKALKTLNDEHGTTYYVIFAASLLDDSGNPQIFEAKFFMSPLFPTTKIKIKFVRIKGKGKGN